MKNDNLKEFYDDVADTYYNSRNKHRNDWAIIAKEIQSYWKKEISILEFWCGWWRCIKFLNENLKWIKINYVWVDISNKLLNFARKDNPNNTFVCENIINYINKAQQEKFDFIIWIASFQHIEKYEQRLFLMKNFYRILKYWGELIMTNRSYSNRFFKKYKQSILSSTRKTIYTFWWHNIRDLSIPRKAKSKTYNRFYHIFTKKELSMLCKECSFDIKELTYLNSKWEQIDAQWLSNNTLLIAQKAFSKNIDNFRQR